MIITQHLKSHKISQSGLILPDQESVFHSRLRLPIHSTVFSTFRTPCFTPLFIHPSKLQPQHTHIQQGSLQQLSHISLKP